MMTAALAPSESWLALPPVIVKPAPFAGLTAARPSAVVSGRGPSSVESVTTWYDTAPEVLSVTAMVVLIGASSSLNRPPCWADAVRRWLSRLYSS